jgi:hypothetical protein
MRLAKYWPWPAFALGQVWACVAIHELLGVVYVFAWWAAWLIGAALLEWFGPES